MSRSDCVLFIALVGLAVLHPVQMSLHAQQSAEQTSQQPPQSPKPIDLTPIRNEIERLTRAVESIKVDGKSAAETMREVSDLEAQQEMAKWARLMYCVTALSTAFTLIGLLMIAGTLYYTGQSARHTEGMLREAENTTAAAKESLKLANPPRFKLTRPIIHKLGEDRSAIPNFEAGEPIQGRAFLINSGRYAASLEQDERDPRPWDADCYIFFSTIDGIQMGQVYKRWRDVKAWSQPHVHVPRDSNFTLPKIPPGGILYFDLRDTIPADFTVTYDEGRRKFSHTIFIVGHIRYLGAAKEPRGAYFCKRYDPDRFCFFDAPEYEHED